MILMLIIAVLAAACVLATIVTALRDDRGRVPQVWDHDTRRPAT